MFFVPFKAFKNHSPSLHNSCFVLFVFFSKILKSNFNHVRKVSTTQLPAYIGLALMKDANLHAYEFRGDVVCWHRCLFGVLTLRISNSDGSPNLILILFISIIYYYHYFIYSFTSFAFKWSFLSWLLRFDLIWFDLTLTVHPSRWNSWSTMSLFGLKRVQSRTSSLRHLWHSSLP